MRELMLGPHDQHVGLCCMVPCPCASAPPVGLNPLLWTLPTIFSVCVLKATQVAAHNLYSAVLSLQALLSLHWSEKLCFPALLLCEALPSICRLYMES